LQYTVLHITALYLPWCIFLSCNGMGRRPETCVKRGKYDLENCWKAYIFAPDFITTLSRLFRIQWFRDISISFSGAQLQTI